MHISIGIESAYIRKCLWLFIRIQSFLIEFGIIILHENLSKTHKLKDLIADKRLFRYPLSVGIIFCCIIQILGQISKIAESNRYEDDRFMQQKSEEIQKQRSINDRMNESLAHLNCEGLNRKNGI